MSKQTRLETGNVTPDNDWTGVYIRGDNAMHYAMQLSDIIETLEKCNEDYFTIMQMRSLKDLLQRCTHVNGIPEYTQLVKIEFVEKH